MRSTTTDEGRITFERNTEFSGPGLQVFVALDDGRSISVNTTGDAIGSQPWLHPFPAMKAVTARFSRRRRKEHRSPVRRQAGMATIRPTS